MNNLRYIGKGRRGRKARGHHRCQVHGGDGTDEEMFKQGARTGQGVVWHIGSCCDKWIEEGFEGRKIVDSNGVNFQTKMVELWMEVFKKGRTSRGLKKWSSDSEMRRELPRG